MLIKRLAEITARELRNTRGVFPQLKEQLRLVESAYGAAAVESDFQSWTQEVKDNPPQYPISEYLKIVDTRMRDGGASSPEESDPKITEIISKVYEICNRPASNRDVEKLLTKFESTDILEAFEEYTAKLDDGEMKYAVKNFFRDGGAEGIILARQNRKQTDANQKASVSQSISAGLAEHDAQEQELQRKRAEENEIAERIAENPLALFGG